MLRERLQLLQLIENKIIYIYVDGKSKKKLITAKIQTKNKKKKLILLKYIFKL
jgi:hypothetical protein